MFTGAKCTLKTCKLDDLPKIKEKVLIITTHYDVIVDIELLKCFFLLIIHWLIFYANLELSWETHFLGANYGSYCPYSFGDFQWIFYFYGPFSVGSNQLSMAYMASHGKRHFLLSLQIDLVYNPKWQLTFKGVDSHFL